jgi:hypothetical protein
LRLAGLARRPSLLSRLLPSIGIASLLAAAGAAIVLFAPKLRAARDRWNLETRIGEPRSGPPSASADSRSEHDSTGHTASPVVGSPPRVGE